MAQVRVLIVCGPGTNCEQETAHAWKLAGALPRIVRLNEAVARPSLLEEAQILTLAGGFAHGDDIAGGKILATELKLYLSDALRRFVADGKLILGVCNGFQVLVKSGLLPGGGMGDDAVTLAFNTSGRYEDRWVHIKPASDRCLFIDTDELLYAPVAHAEGRIVTRDDDTLNELKNKGHVAFLYVDENGREGTYPVNPNGSMGSVAGLTDETGQVLGLMPHPERHVHFTHHPCWTRLPRDRQPDGLRVFRAAVARLQ